MIASEVLAVLGWLVAAANVIAIAILVKRTDDLENRLWAAERGSLVVTVRGTRINLNDFLGRLTRKLNLDLVHEPESVRLVDEETRR